MKPKTAADYFAFIIGLLLAIEGVWELFSPVVFGVLTGNPTHGVIHIILGLTGMWLGRRSQARGFCILLGVILVVAGGLWFIPAGNDLVVRLLNMNQAVAVVNLIVGAISLAFASRRIPVTANRR